MGDSFFCTLFREGVLMKSKTVLFNVRLTQSELQQLKEKARLSGLSCSALIRMLIAGCKIQARPTEEYVKLIREISAIGHNLNQLTRLANASGTLSQAQARLAADYLHQVLQLVKGEV